MPFAPTRRRLSWTTPTRRKTLFPLPFQRTGRSEGEPPLCMGPVGAPHDENRRGGRGTTGADAGAGGLSAGADVSVPRTGGSDAGRASGGVVAPRLRGYGGPGTVRRRAGCDHL